MATVEKTRGKPWCASTFQIVLASPLKQFIGHSKAQGQSQEADSTYHEAKRTHSEIHHKLKKEVHSTQTGGSGGVKIC